MRLLTVLLCFVLAQSALAEIHSGVGQEPWDFSEFSVAPSLLPWDPWDFGIAITADASTAPMELFVWANYYNGAMVLRMPPEVIFEDLEAAPAPDSLYSGWAPFDPPFPRHVFVFRTTEGHYAKVLFHSDGGHFDYVYQDDGSRSFTPVVPVEETTWGAIKALYNK